MSSLPTLHLATGNSPHSTGIVHLKNFEGKRIDTKGFTVLLVTSGYASISVNCKLHPLRPGYCAMLFYDDRVSFSAVSPDFEIRFSSVGYEIIDEILYKMASSILWEGLFAQPVFRLSRQQIVLLNGWFNQMDWIVDRQDDRYGREMLTNNLHTLLMAVDNQMSHTEQKPREHGRNRGWKIITQFLKLVAHHCNDNRDVQFYADQLCITTTYLYKLCQKHIGHSPKEFIDNHTIAEIKTYLTDTDLSVRNIADRLHFESDTYLARYFKKRTGLSPISYRNRNKR